MTSNEKLEYIASRVSYDKDNGIFTNIKTGRIIGFKHNTMSKNRTYYIKIEIDNIRVYAHRLAWFIVNGSISDKMLIDHIDKDGTNNKIENLRLVTPSENNRNVDIKSNNTTGVKGITINRHGNYSISIDGKHKATTKTLEEAITIRKELELEHWGESW